LVFCTKKNLALLNSTPARECQALKKGDY
jgi:hypothetical protein